MNAQASQTGSATTADETKTQNSNLSSLKAIGLSDETISAVIAAEQSRAVRGNKISYRVGLDSHIFENRDAIIAAYGRHHVTASQVIAFLKTKGICKEGKHANAVGDACGKKGLQLPSFIAGGRRYYDLSMAGATDADREERQQLLDTLNSTVRLAAAGLLTSTQEAAK